VVPSAKYKLSALQGLIESLETAVKKLEWQPPKSSWATYYESTVTGGKYLEHKQRIIAEFLRTVEPRSVWDLGANTGLFSRIAAAGGADTLSFDGDPDCVEINFLEMRRQKDARLLPLWMDLTNPSPALGWANAERMSWMERQNPDLVLALGLIHHLAIANNLPLSRIRDFLARLSPWLAIEFVPKTDANARELLTVREDIFADYTQEGFEKEFSLSYAIERKVPVQDSRRVLFLMRRRGDNDSTQEGYAPQQGRKSIHSSGLESSAKGDGAIREISAR
jgi:ribosomal protein L11 methylase PrmA